MIDQPMWWGLLVPILAFLMYGLTRPANILHEASLTGADLVLRLRLCWDFCVNSLLIFCRRRTLSAQIRGIDLFILRTAKKKQHLQDRIEKDQDLSSATCQEANQVIDLWSDQIKSLQELSNKNLVKIKDDLKTHL